MITYKKAILRVGEVFFNEPDAAQGLDILRYQSRLEPLPQACCEQRHTILIQLDRPESELWSAVNKTTRNEISRSERDGAVCHISTEPGQQQLTAFADFWAQFAPRKGLPPLNLDRLEGMRASGALMLTHATNAAGETLVWHCHVRSGQWLRLVHSASLYRASDDKEYQSRISRANRLLHWREISAMRELGHTVFDFGGWYAGEEDKALLNINRFKEGFGGDIVPVYYADCGVSLRGRVALELKRMWSRN